MLTALSRVLVLGRKVQQLNLHNYTSVHPLQIQQAVTQLLCDNQKDRNFGNCTKNSMTI